MSNDISATMKAAIAAQETGEVILILLEIDHASLLSPIRVVNNNNDITSNGELFVAYPFSISLPSDNRDDTPRTKLAIDNVDRSLMQTIRSITTPPSVRIMIVMASDPDVVEVDMPGFALKNISADALSISGDLSVDDFTTEPFPGDRMLPSTFPGIF